MTDPLTTSIATALATGATAALSDGVRALITKLATLVRDRFRQNPPDEETLVAASSNPHDLDAVKRLAELLGQRMRGDPEFAERLRALWTDIAAAGPGHRDEITNVVSGPVHGSVVQARDVHGGITFHGPPRPPPTQP